LADDEGGFEAVGERALGAPGDVGEDGLELGRIRGIEDIDAGAFFEEPGGLIEVFIFGGAAHAGPDERLYGPFMRFANGFGDGGEFGGDAEGPIAVLGGEPGEVEEAVGVLGDVAVRVGLHADADERAAGRVQGGETFAAGLGIEGLELGEQAVLGESGGERDGGGGVVEEGEIHALVVTHGDAHRRCLIWFWVKAQGKAGDGGSGGGIRRSGDAAVL